MKRILIILAILTLTTNIYSQFAGGSGTEADPYQITTAVQLDSVRHHLDKSFILMNDIDFEGTVYDSANSSNNEGWVPISIFSGFFNGKGFSIKNMYINRPSTRFVGLFGQSKNAILDSIKLININITGTAYTGALSGNNTASEITYSSSSGNITGTNSVGGLVGSNDFSSFISNSHSSCSITASDDVGGIVGYNNSSSKMTNCYSNCLIAANDYVGGLVGHNQSYSLVTTSYSTSTITGRNHIGGLIGYNLASLSTSYSNCSVTGNSNVGGVVGNNESSSSRILDSYSTGTVKGVTNVGGLAGVAYSSKDSCNYSLCSVEGNVNIGGLIGLSTGGPIIYSSFSAGLVIGITNVGGLIGKRYSGSIIDCYYDTEITNQVDNGMGYPKTTMEMKVGKTYENWNFDTEWALIEYTSYPQRIWEINGWGDSIIDSIISQDSLTIFCGKNSFIDYNLKPLGNNKRFQIKSLDSSIVQVDSTGFVFASNIGETQVVVYSTDNPFVADTTLVTVLQFFSGGNGSIDNPYQIRTIKDLDSIRHNLSSHYILMNNLDFLGSTYDSLDNYSFGWDPIGHDNARFTGSFNGNNYIINNLYINSSVDKNLYNGYYIGLFGATTGASIHNLGIENCRINGYIYVGPLIASSANSCTVTNCYATGTIRGSTHVGGLVGHNYSASLIKESYSECKVIGETYVGGLIGMNANSGTVHNSYATGLISGNDNIGGLIGSNYYWTHLVNSYATGSVTGNSNVGGFVGYTFNSSSDYLNCYFDEEASGQTDNSAENKLTSEMLIISTYIDWGFDSIWTIDESVSYPKLSWDTLSFNSPNITSIAPLNATEDIEYIYTIGVVDQDDSIFNYHLINPPDEMSIHDNIIRWTPSNGVSSSGEVLLIIEDIKGLRAIEKFTIIVTPVNNAPIIISNPDSSCAINEEFTYIVSAYDIDSDSLFYSIVGEPQGMQIIDSVITWIPTSNTSPTEEISLIVTDGLDSTIQRFSLNIDIQTSIHIQKFIPSSFLLTIAPTPTTNIATILTSSKTSGTATFTLFNTNKQKIATTTKGISSNEKLKFKWNIISTLPSGIYFIEMEINGETKAISRLIKIDK